MPTDIPTTSLPLIQSDWNGRNLFTAGAGGFQPAPQPVGRRATLRDLAQNVLRAQSFEEANAAIPFRVEVVSNVETEVFIRGQVLAKALGRQTRDHVPCPICQQEFNIVLPVAADQQTRHERDCHPCAVCVVCGVFLVNRGPAQIRKHRISGCVVWRAVVERGWHENFLRARGYLDSPTTQFFTQQTIDLVESEPGDASQRLLLQKVWDYEIAKLVSRGVTVPPEIVTQYTPEPTQGGECDRWATKTLVGSSFDEMLSDDDENWV